MLSYHHAYHAGNHADVLKHYVLCSVLNYFNQKEKPYWVIDTHAGAGMYSLNSEHANKNSESNTGINRLINAENLSESLLTYINCIKSFNTKNQLNVYPGSPKIAEYFLRDNDKLRLLELHPNEYELLMENFKSKARQTTTSCTDGFTGIKALLPPKSKRGIVLIDPPYEVKQDYHYVVNCIKGSLKRFETGTYIIWYPQLQRTEPSQMIQKLKELNIKDWLDVNLTIEQPSPNGYGMYGSGLFVINPPWTLMSTLEDAMPIITDVLAQDNRAKFNLDISQ